MTCVAAAYDPASGQFAIASDSATERGYARVYRPTPKYLHAGRNLVIGWCGSSTHERFVASLPADVSTPEQVCDLWLGWLETRKTVADIQSNLLVCSAEGLAVLDQAGAVIRSAHNYTAIGSGTETALGALCALAGLRMALDLRVRAAVHAAICHAVGCDGTVFSLSG